MESIPRSPLEHDDDSRSDKVVKPSRAKRIANWAESCSLSLLVSCGMRDTWQTCQDSTSSSW